MFCQTEVGIGKVIDLQLAIGRRLPAIYLYIQVFLFVFWIMPDSRGWATPFGPPPVNLSSHPPLNSDRQLGMIESLTQYNFMNARHIRHFQEAAFIRTVHFWYKRDATPAPESLRSDFKLLIRKALYYKEAVGKALYMGTYISGIGLRYSGRDWSFPPTTITVQAPVRPGARLPSDYHKNYTQSYGAKRSDSQKMSFEDIKDDIIAPPVTPMEWEKNRPAIWIPSGRYRWNIEDMDRARWTFEYAEGKKWIKRRANRFTVDLTNRHVRRWFIERIIQQMQEINSLVQEAKREYEDLAGKKKALAGDIFYGRLRHNKHFRIEYLTIDNIGPIYPSYWYSDTRYQYFTPWKMTAPTWIFLATFLRQLRHALRAEKIRTIHIMGGYMDGWLQFSNMIKEDRIAHSFRKKPWGLGQILRMYRDDPAWRTQTDFDTYRIEDFLPERLADGALMEGFFSPYSRLPENRAMIGDTVKWLQDRLREKTLLLLYTDNHRWFEFTQLCVLAVMLRKPGDAVFVLTLPQLFDHPLYQLPALYSDAGWRPADSAIESTTYRPALPAGRQPIEYCQIHNKQVRLISSAQRIALASKKPPDFRLASIIPISNESAVIGRWFVQQAACMRWATNAKAQRYCVAHNRPNAMFLYFDIGKSLSDQRRYRGPHADASISPAQLCYVRHLFRASGDTETFIPLDQRNYAKPQQTQKRNAPRLTSIGIYQSTKPKVMSQLSPTEKNSIFGHDAFLNVLYAVPSWRKIGPHQLPD